MGSPPTDASDLDIASLILDTAHFADEVIQANLELPNSPPFHGVMAGPEHNKWHAAILEELTVIKDAGTWEIINQSLKICNIIGCWFILQKKHGPEGEITRYKACIVAQGFGQQEGIDYLEMFTPVVKSALLCVFLEICTQHSWKIHQMDIKLAYLNGSISEDIYMHQPKGYEERGSKMKFAKLKKGLYGLKQAGWEWYTTLHTFLIQIGFHHTHADHSVFIFEQGQSIIIVP